MIVNTVFAVGMRHESSSKLAMQAFTIPLAAGWYAIVRMRSKMRNSKKSVDSNWGPWSDLTNLDGSIQFCRKAMMAFSVCRSVKGMALHHQVKRFTQVKWKRCPRDMHMMKALIGGIASTNRCVIVAMPLGSRALNAAPRQVVKPFCRPFQ